MKNFKIFNILFLFALTSVLALAQNITFKAEANKKTVAVGDHLQIGFFIEAEQMDYTIDKPMRYPDHQGFRIIGEEKTQQVQYINGKGLVQDGIILIFQAEREGKFKIGTARISIDGKSYATKPIEIEVLKASSSNISTKPASNQPAFLQTNVSNANPYVNEQVNLTIKMFSQDLGLLNRKRNFRQGKLEGLSPKMVTSRPESIKQEMISGKQYFSEEVAKYVIFPEKEGQITIDPFSLDILVSGIYGTEAYEIRSNPVIINAKPIPEEGRPKNFAGAVGDFKLKTDLNKNEIKANESTNLKVEISGTGNLNKLIIPEINVPKNIETYNPKKYNNFKTYEDGMQGSITSEFIMVPEQEGSYTISPVEFSYFDPKKEEFITLTTDEVKLSVNGKVDNDDDDEEEDEDNEKETISSTDKKSLLNSDWLWTAGGSLLILGTAGLFLVRRKKNQKENEITQDSDFSNQKYMPNPSQIATFLHTESSLSTENKKLFISKLTVLQENIQHSAHKSFYQQQEDLLCQIGMKLTQTDLANFSDYSVGEKLILKGWDATLVNDWKELLAKARQAKYSASMDNTNDDLTEIYLKTERLVKQFIQ